MLEPSRDTAALCTAGVSTLEFIRQLKEKGEPIVLTVNGKAELVIQDATSYQKLLELVDRLEAIEGIRAGLEDVAAGRTKSLEQMREEFQKRHGISR